MVASGATRHRARHRAGEQRRADLEQPDDQVRPKHPSSEAEQPGRHQQQQPGGDVEEQVDTHRDHAHGRVFVVREQGVEDQRAAQRLGHPLGCAVIGKSEDVGQQDQQRAGQVVQDPVGPGRDEAHRGLPSGGAVVPRATHAVSHRFAVARRRSGTRRRRSASACHPVT
jgi:hypothetical protein